MSLNFFMFAGINGAGKSTLYSTLNADNSYEVKNSKRTNADEIAKENHWDWHDPANNLKAMKIEMENVHLFINEKQSFNMETTLASSKKTYLKLLDSAKEQGFTTNLLYVGVSSPEIAKSRVKNRVAKGGHGLPDAIIDRRYPKSLKNLELLAPFFDNMEIYDNTTSFKIVYSRNKYKAITLDPSIDWAKPSIKADQDALQTKLLEQQIKKFRGRER
ncbi:ATPase [Lactobacillus bombicola]|uniref:UDP-N-acetylglucosamine kinase n=1 Tax=Lactobacillus bombicola TaxID=1505723 RepID=A0ABX9LST8_9LACO|nr:zeta toxin family protein [Lactobacillus bombicola]RHW49259.1 ATPase [Lactobacillus bombicola]